MRTPSLILCLLSATLITGSAIAQSEMSPKDDAPAAAERKGMNHPKRQELVKKYDKNGDGRIDDDELAEARSDMRKDGSGASMQRMERQKKLLKEFDKNGDGKLDDTERAAADKAVQRYRENAEKRQAEIVKRFDKDKDGELNEAERAEAEKARDELKQEYEARREMRQEKKDAKK